MALGGLFGKKKPDVPSPGKPPGGAMPPGLARNMMNTKETPAQLVMRMQRQGMSYQDIVGAMQREGYSQTQISEAMDQATQLASQQPAGAQAGMPPPPGGSPNMPPPMNKSGGMPPPGPNQTIPSPPMRGHRQNNADQIDELVERTVQEKWESFSDRLKELNEFKASMEARLASVETQLERMDTKFDNLKNAVIAKIKDYDTSILNVGTEMKAMEQVFQKILPDLQQNVSELSRVTTKLGGKKPPAKK